MTIAIKEGRRVTKLSTRSKRIARRPRDFASLGRLGDWTNRRLADWYLGRVAVRAASKRESD